ncbi:MAG: hypothetical protein PHO86_03385 [Bacilli bacterium]|nr:hypothetical protein [Bacilli bacterium]
MEYINIQNLRFRNLEINFSINEQEIFAVYSRNKKIVEEFLLIINGANPNDGACTYKNKDIFDNKEFFGSRIYFDFKNIYLKTMKTEFIEEALENRFKLSFNKEIFDTYVRIMGTRIETTVGVNYTFTKTGNTMVNFALLKAINCSSIFVNNPTVNLKNSKIIEIITKGLVDKEKYECVILGLDSIKNFDGKLDKVLVFSDYWSYFIINPSVDSFLLVEDNIHLHDKIFRTSESNLVICLNNYTKEELKKFNGYKIKYQKKTFYELEEYFGA